MFLHQFQASCPWHYCHLKDFIKRNKQWYRYEKYLDDRPSQPWTYFTSLDKLLTKRQTKKKTIIKTKTKTSPSQSKKNRIERKSRKIKHKLK